MKVVIGLAVVAVLAALATNWLRDKGISLVHHAIDTALPGEIDGRVWTPIDGGHALPASRVRFSSEVTTVRCHRTLGTYTVAVDHRFSFTPAVGPIRKGCPGRSLRATLQGATRVDVERHGTRLEMTLSNEDSQTVATFRSRVD